MKDKPLFFPHAYYVIHNHGNADETIFKCEANYYLFLGKLEQYMGDVWQLIGWCLVPDGYKLIIRVKDNFQNDISLSEKSRIISLKFSHFTNSYAKTINQAYRRRGSLFARNFKRDFIADDNELKKEIIEMHNKPCERNYVDSPFDWKFSSIKRKSFLSSNLQYDEMIRSFKSRENFFIAHRPKKENAAA